jgi:Macrocin-O-methyltransferase (TylF)
MLQRTKDYLRRITDSPKKHTVALDLTSQERELVVRIRAKNLTYLSDKKLASLASTCRAIQNADLPGLFIETGCALGGSAILISSVKSAERPFLVFDVFGMIPPPTKEDTQDVHDRYKAIADAYSD